MHQIIWSKMPGSCKGITIDCGVHQSFYSGETLLVADINAPAEHLRLDRVVVTACTKFALKTSFRCMKHTCKDDICNTVISFMKPDGTTVKRSYKSVIHKGDKNNIDHTTVERGNLKTCESPFQMKLSGKLEFYVKKDLVDSTNFAWIGSVFRYYIMVGSP